MKKRNVLSVVRGTLTVLLMALLLCAFLLPMPSMESAWAATENWTVDGETETFTGDDTANGTDDHIMAEYYLIPSECKMEYKASVSVKMLATNGRPGTRLALIPWYVDNNNWIAAYMSNSSWDGGRISVMVQVKLNGSLVYDQFYLPSETHDMINSTERLTVLVSTERITFWFNDTQFDPTGVNKPALGTFQGIGTVAENAAEVRYGFLVSNVRATFSNASIVSIDSEAVGEAKEELTWESFNTSETINNVTANFSLPTNAGNGVAISWASSDTNTITISNALAVVTPATETKTVLLTATLTKGNATATKKFEITVPKASEEMLTAAKESANNELDAYRNDNGFYNAAEWEQITSLISTAKTIIESATAVAEVNAALLHATDRIAVITAKVNAKNSLAEYAVSKGKENYFDDGWSAIQSIVSATRAEIDEAQNTDAISAILQQARNKINAVESALSIDRKWTINANTSTYTAAKSSAVGDIEAKSEDSYLGFPLKDSLNHTNEYYVSVTVSNIGDLNNQTQVGIIPWYVDNSNWVLFYVHTWGGDNANVELVSKWIIGGGDNWQDNSCIIFSGPRADWNNYFTGNTYNVWARIKGDQVLFGIDTLSGNYANNNNVYVPTAGRDWNSKNKYQGTFEIPGLANAISSNFEKSRAGFDARRCSATFSNFYLGNEVKAVNQAVSYAKFDIERYVVETDYYVTQWEEIGALIGNAKTAFESAASLEALDASIVSYHSQINAVGTKDKVDAEAAATVLTWEQVNANETADSVTSNYTLPVSTDNNIVISWTSSNSSVIAISGSSAVVTPAEGQASTVTLTATFTKGNATATRSFEVTVPQATEDGLAAAKDTAKNTLDAYNNDNEFYPAAEWEQITSLISEAKTKIDAASTVADVNAASLKATDAIALITAKVNAKNALAEYAAAKGENNYLAEEWSAIQDILTTSREHIDAAQSSDEIEPIVNAAKKQIDAVERAIVVEGKWTINTNLKTYTSAKQGNGDIALTDSFYKGMEIDDTYLVDGEYHYYTSVTIDVSDISFAGEIALVPWYADQNNYLVFFVHSWSNYNKVELVPQWVSNGTRRDNCAVIQSNVTEADKKLYFENNVFTLWVRVIGDQVLYGIDVADGEKADKNLVNNTNVFVSTSGSNTGYQTSFRISGLSAAMKNVEHNYVGLEARNAAATFTNFYLGKEAEAVNQAIAYAKFDIERYETDSSKYYEAQWTEIQTLIVQAKTVFEAVVSVTDLNEKIAEYQAKIDAVKTIGEVDLDTAYEALTWESLSGEPIGNVVLSFNLPATMGDNGVTVTWISSDTTTIAINDSRAIVTLSEESQKVVTLTATLSKNGITTTKEFVITVPQADNSVLENAKNAAKQALDAYSNDDDFYNASEWQAITELITRAKDAIEAATDLDGVNTALAEAKSSVAFITAKVNAKNALAEYAAAKGENNYLAEEWAMIADIVSSAQAHIDEADTAERIKEIIESATTAIDAVEKTAISEYGKWLVNSVTKTYTGDDTANNTDDHLMAEYYVVPSEHKIEYKITVSIKMLATNGRPGTRVALIPWYVDGNNWIAVYMSKSSWDANKITVMVQSRINGELVYNQFETVYDSSYEMLNEEQTLTVLVSEKNAAVWYNGMAFRNVSIRGIGEVAASAEEVKYGFLVCNTRAVFYDIVIGNTGSEVVEGELGDYIVKGASNDFWQLDAASGAIIGDDSNGARDAVMAYYAIKEIQYSSVYFVNADITTLQAGELALTRRIGLIPLFFDNDNWVAVYMTKSTQDSPIVLMLQAKLNGELICNVSQALYPATEDILNVTHSFSVWITGDHVVVIVKGARNYALGARIEGLADTVHALTAGAAAVAENTDGEGMATEKRKVYAGVSVVGTQAKFENFTVVEATDITLDNNTAVALARYTLDSYKNESDYYSNEWNEVRGYIADAVNAFEDEGADIDALVAEAKEKIDTVVTKAIIDKENAAEEARALATAKQSAKAELDVYAATFSSDDYSSENWSALLDMITQAKSDIDASETQADVNSVMEQVKDDLDSVKKISDGSDNPPKQNVPDGLTAGEIVAIVFSVLFVIGAAVALVFALKKNGGKKND